MRRRSHASYGHQLECNLEIYGFKCNFFQYQYEGVLLYYGITVYAVHTVLLYYHLTSETIFINIKKNIPR